MTTAPPPSRADMTDPTPAYPQQADREEHARDLVARLRALELWIRSVDKFGEDASAAAGDLFRDVRTEIARGALVERSLMLLAGADTADPAVPVLALVARRADDLIAALDLSAMDYGPDVTAARSALAGELTRPEVLRADPVGWIRRGLAGLSGRT